MFKGKNKMVSEAANKAEARKEEYHFAGEGKYQPLTVLASSPAEALELWEAQRKEVNQ